MTDLVWPLRNTVVGSLGHKPKCAFTPNHEALDDLNGVVQSKIHQSVEAVASGALDGKLAADEGCELLIRLYSGRQIHNTSHQLLVTLQHNAC